MLNYWHVSMYASKAAGAQRVAGKKKKMHPLYHTISKQHPMTAYLNGNASDTIFSLGKIKMKMKMQASCHPHSNRDMFR